MLTSVWTTKLTLTKSKLASVIKNGAHCAPFFLSQIILPFPLYASATTPQNGAKSQPLKSPAHWPGLGYHPVRLVRL
ncbi:hypothetical protein CEQ31_005880 [Serratia odorifera]|nr:hypothetical protein CEQ31_005880 [Serratia odorifera]RII70185.1 hypothetical protein DX901_20425 [Serratia odorifera]